MSFQKSADKVDKICGEVRQRLEEWSALASAPVRVREHTPVPVRELTPSLDDGTHSTTKCPHSTLVGWRWKSGSLTADALSKSSKAIPPEDSTSLIKSVHALRRRPVGDLTPEELARLIGQNVGLP
ncbi:contact-dependent growth inhibition system immunity protein [Streptomyces sp. bgisy084]|uniref:contact-dependent growth inhibition system immunity protein n=1 Tax=Streptomyces sp. bgisy084 TaxID=3413777 RepID=UPI003D75234D